MEETMKYVLAGILLLMATVASAITPDEIRQKYPLVRVDNCTDAPSGEEGICYIFQDTDTDGHVYMVFVQDGQPVFARHASKAGYNRVWPVYEPPGINA